MENTNQQVPSMEEMQLQQQQKVENEERRISILEQILEAPAKERLSRLAIVKKDKVRSVEDNLIKAATSGQLRNKVTEEQLIAILEGTKNADGTAVKLTKGITVQRRNYAGLDDDDDDDDSDLL